MVGTALYAQLTANPGVSALVGLRVYPKLARQTDQTFPQIVYHVEDGESVRSYAGSSNLVSKKVKVVARGKTNVQANQAAEAAKLALDNQSGTWGGIVVQGAFVEDGPEGLEEDEKVPFVVNTRELEVTVWYQPTA